ncbi:MAG: fumarylacetoacetate hydrolase family protein [Thermoleophilia bacterium]|nr:fumarylacetoacetate hydrolase family protein [Thermoleophilia bacterium]MDH4346817.1 fumarylacetoacetate hydrolase family protein [Thermoleophilia bacterium]
MRLVTYEAAGRVGVGAERGDAVFDTGYADMHDLIASGDEGLARAAAAVEAGVAVEGAALKVPIVPGKVLCCGINFRSHGAEAASANVPQEPYFFAKLPSAVSGPGDPIVIPFPEAKVDWEVELAFVVGRRAKNVAAADALDHVFGYTLLHDVSARAVQLEWTSRTQDSQITLGKNPDGFSPIGPAIVTKDEIPDPNDVRIGTWVNGVQKQDASTADWLFTIPVLVEFLTRLVTLEPGDVVSTGTPAGIGYFRDPPEFLQPGDEVTIGAEGIGRLTNPVVAGW